MSYELFFLDDEYGSITEFHGMLTDKLLIECTKERYSSEERNSNFKYILNDYSDCTEINISTGAVIAVANMAIEVSRINQNIVIAAAMPTDLIFGLGRMWQAYADETGWNSHAFHSRQEAETWICEQLNQDLNFNNQSNNTVK